MGQRIGWSTGLVLLIAACDSPTARDGVPASAGSTASAGSVGSVASAGSGSICIFCDAGIDLGPSPGSAGNGGNGGASDAGTCVGEAGAPPELRPGCPQDPPAAGDCANEGLRCLYGASDPNCRAEWECVYGIWSPNRDQCSTEPGVPENDSGCPGLEPIDGEPCPSAALECDYVQCSVGHPAVHATCECGRWNLQDWGCIEVP